MTAECGVLKAKVTQGKETRPYRKGCFEGPSGVGSGNCGQAGIRTLADLPECGRSKRRLKVEISKALPVSGLGQPLGRPLVNVPFETKVIWRPGQPGVVGGSRTPTLPLDR